MLQQPSLGTADVRHRSASVLLQYVQYKIVPLFTDGRLEHDSGVHGHDRIGHFYDGHMDLHGVPSRVGPGHWQRIDRQLYCNLGRTAQSNLQARNPH